MGEKFNYEELGFKCGLEIHQQLDTNKLFCNCPSIIRDDEPDFTVKRHIRASAGEGGKFDIAAEMEQKKKISFVYEGYDDTTCLVELDEEPPKPMNNEALNTVLQVSKLLKCNFVDEIQIMRKTIVNGSVTSGFQRTALVAFNGEIKNKTGDIGINAVCIEEDSCRDIETKKNKRTFRLDRLGIPLIEITTKPDIKNPEHAKEIAAHIGMVLRSTGKVKRGLGTIRQDLNVSIKGGSRIEIKGAQDLKLIPELIHNEVIRQIALLKIKEEIGKLQLKFEMIEITDLVKDADSKIIQKALSLEDGIVLAIKLDGFHGFLGREVQPGKRLGTELSDYGKVYGGVKGLFHSDELPNYGLKQEHVDKIKNLLKCGQNDAFIMIADSKSRAKNALKGAFNRAELVLKGIPEEVRKANFDATTSYLRPVPGAARMYPETDLKSISPDISSIKVPKLISELEEDLKKLGMQKDLASKIAKEGLTHKLLEYSKKFDKLKANYIGELLLVVGNFEETDKTKLLKALNDEQIAKESVEAIVERMSKGEKFEDVVKDYYLLSDKDLEGILKEVVANFKGKSFNIIMGEAMKLLRGKAPGNKISSKLQKLLKD